MWQGTPVRCAKLANERQGEVLIWLAPRFYPGKSGLHGLFISSPSRSEDGPTVYNDSSRYRVAKAGLRSRALLRVSTGTVPILERKLFIPIRHRRGIAPGRFGIGLIPLRPGRYESEIESSYASTRQMAKSLYFFNSLDDW